MTKCETKRWSLFSTDFKTLGEEIESFLNSEEVVALQTFVVQGQLIVIAIFGNA